MFIPLSAHNCVQPGRAGKCCASSLWIYMNSSGRWFSYYLQVFDIRAPTDVVNLYPGLG